MMNVKNRLAMYRKRASNAAYPTNWRQCRYASMNSYRDKYQSHIQRGGVIYADDLDVIGNKIADAHELIRLDHTGYFADIYESSVIRGAVVKLRTCKGVYYIPATYCTEWDGVTLHIKDAEIVAKGATEDEHEEAKKEAARSSDHYAEKEAEQAREECEKDAAEQRCEEYREEAKQCRESVRELIKEIRQHGAFSPAICATLRKEIRRALESIQNCRMAVKELTDSPCMIHEYR